MLKSYVKKPVVIQAVKFEYTEECLHFLEHWMQDSFGKYSKDRHILAKGELVIYTLEDGKSVPHHVATEGDYIIKGVKGEFYPCKPDIFELTYQVLEGE